MKPQGRCFYNNKIMYRNRITAWRATFYFQDRFEDIYSPYKCRHCKTWHLTTACASEPPKELKLKVRKLLNEK